jgi:hypothetical protein
LRIGKRKNLWVGISVLVLCLVLAGTYVFEKMTDRMLSQISTEILLALAPEPEIEIPAEGELDSETGVIAEQTDAETSADPFKPEVSQGGQSPTAADSIEPAKPVASPNDAPVVQVKVDPAEVTLADKAKAYTLAAKRLSPAEMNNLLKWSQGGFTITEKENAQALFNHNFTPDEQAWILDMFRKYND